MIDRRSVLSLLQSTSTTTEHLSSDADAPPAVLAADRSTVVVAATGVKRIDRPHRSINAVDLELRGSVIDNSTVSLLFFRYCPNPIAHADAPAVAAADRFTAIAAAVAVSLQLFRCCCCSFCLQ